MQNTCQPICLSIQDDIYLCWMSSTSCYESIFMMQMNITEGVIGSCEVVTFIKRLKLNMHFKTTLTCWIICNMFSGYDRLKIVRMHFE